MCPTHRAAFQQLPSSYRVTSVPHDGVDWGIERWTD
jgi:hypothetical protein